MQQADFWNLVAQTLPYLRRNTRSYWKKTLAGSRTGAIYSAEDILQEALLKIGRNPSLLHYDVYKEGLERLVNVTVKCVVLDIVRRNDTKRCSSLEKEMALLGLEHADSLIPHSADMPDKLLEQAQAKELVTLLLEGLATKSFLNAACLSFSLEEVEQGDGYTRKEMAAYLGMSENNYKQRRFQGIREIRSRYSTLLTQYTP